MNTPALLSLQQVGLDAGQRTLVDDLTLHLERGDVLGLLGVNGAGKTTTLRMIAGVLAPTRGRVLLDGGDLADDPGIAHRRIGYLPERPPLHDELRVDEYLRYCARLHGVPRTGATTAVEAAIDACDLESVRLRLIGNLSQGFRQRVGIAQAIIHEPDLVVLDEPASGLDPVQALALRALITTMARSRAVIVSTHQLNDVDACCNRVAIIHHGRLRHAGRLDALAERDLLRIGVNRDVAMVDWLALPGIVAAEPIGDRCWRVQTTPDADRSRLAEAVVQAGWGLRELHDDHPALDAIFLDIALSPARAVAA